MTIQSSTPPSTGAPERDGSRVQVLYIAGAGRSGSTVLNAVLGAHPECIEVGELTNLVEHGWIQELYCACGQRAPECPFWDAVRQEWRRRLGEEDLVRYRELQGRFERLRRLPLVEIESHLGSRSFHEYAARTEALFTAIRTVSGRSTVVDSSKGPVRALCLSRMPGLDVAMVHLVRDGRGVAYSLLRSYGKDVAGGIQRDLPGRSVYRSALFWSVANRLSDVVRWQMGTKRATLARYEDFVADPGKVLRTVGSLTGTDFEPVIEILERGAAVTPGHTIAGNRLRMAGPIRLRLDEKWKEGLSPKHRRIFSLIAGRALSRYGYRRRP